MTVELEDHLLSVETGWAEARGKERRGKPANAVSTGPCLVASEPLLKRRVFLLSCTPHLSTFFSALEHSGTNQQHYP